MNKACVHSAEEVLEELHVEIDVGLGEAEVERCRREFGANRLRQGKRKSTWTILADQFKSLVVIVLLIASVTAEAFGQIVEGITIAAALEWLNLRKCR